MATPVGQLPDPGLLTLFALGAFMMRSAGCTINDMWDKDFDIHVCVVVCRLCGSNEIITEC